MGAEIEWCNVICFCVGVCGLGCVWLFFLFVVDLWLMRLHLFVVYVVVVVEFWAAWWYGCVVVFVWVAENRLYSCDVLFYSCDVFV